MIGRIISCFIAFLLIKLFILGAEADQISTYVLVALLAIKSLIWIIKCRSTRENTEMHKYVNDNVQKAIHHISEKKNIFITGGAGTGKTYVLNQLKNHYEDKLHITSTTGVSAVNISGQTIHSWAGIGIANKPIEKTIKYIKHNKVLYKQILLAELLAIDEISMLDDNTFDYLNKVLKGVRENPAPFGGIQLILVGDFFQLGPINDEDNNPCFKSESWKELNIYPITLKKVIRQTDVNFIKALNNIRKGKRYPEDLKLFYQREQSCNNEEEQKILHIYANNKPADKHNSRCYEEIKGKPYTYDSKDYFYENEEEPRLLTPQSQLSAYENKIMTEFNKDCKAPIQLQLKKGCRVMLLKNINIRLGLVNGACGTVVELTETSITVLFDNGRRERIAEAVFEFTKEGVKRVERHQYPLRLAYGITIHKSQGMTFDKLVVHFNNIRAYGQAYVALSRISNVSGLFIKEFDPNKIIANQDVIEFYESLESVTCSNVADTTQ